MTHATVREACLALPHATEDQPFGETVLVFRIGAKLFALLALDTHPPTLNLKCDPEEVVERQEQYETVGPGYHMNKRHWITVTLDGSVPPSSVRAWIEDAYRLVRASLPRKVQEALG